MSDEQYIYVDKYGSIWRKQAGTDKYTLDAYKISSGNAYSKLDMLNVTEEALLDDYGPVTVMKKDSVKQANPFKPGKKLLLDADFLILAIDYPETDLSWGSVDDLSTAVMYPCEVVFATDDKVCLAVTVTVDKEELVDQLALLKRVRESAHKSGQDRS